MIAFILPKLPRTPSPASIAHRLSFSKCRPSSGMTESQGQPQQDPSRTVSDLTSQIDLPDYYTLLKGQFHSRAGSQSSFFHLRLLGSAPVASRREKCWLIRKGTSGYQLVEYHLISALGPIPDRTPSSKVTTAGFTVLAAGRSAWHSSIGSD